MLLFFLVLVLLSKVNSNALSQKPHKNSVMVAIAVTPALRRVNKADAWGSLASQSSLLDGFQANERSCLQGGDSIFEDDT